MKTLAPVLACLILVAMSPAAMDAFGQIAGAVIVGGVMDLGESESWIFAIGIKDGQSWEIYCRWAGGLPQCVYFLDPQPIL